MSKFYYITLFTLIFNFNSLSQGVETLNLVEYKVKLANEDSKNSDSVANFKSDLKKRAEKTKPLFEEVTGLLYFNKSESLFKLKERLELDNVFEYKIVKVIIGGDYYKNLLTKEKIVHRKSLGKKLNITYNFNQYDWNISTETKFIDKYKCYKATAFKTDYDNSTNKSTVFTITAWFTTDIPVPFGPVGIDGLPGLVLEASKNGRIIFYASKINLKIKTEFKLGRPKNGFEISEKEFLEKLSERINNFRN